MEEKKKKRKRRSCKVHTRVERLANAALITRPDSNSLSTRSSSLWVVFGELDASCVSCVSRE